MVKLNVGTIIFAISLSLSAASSPAENELRLHAPQRYPLNGPLLNWIDGMSKAATAPGTYHPNGDGYLFSLTGSMAITRAAHSGTTLQDGRVLIAGGLSLDTPNADHLTETAELYDPVTGTFASTGSLSRALAFHNEQTVALRDGRVLISGGEADLGTTVGGYVVLEGVAETELYDPATGTFSLSAPLAGPRDNATATLLQDGRVLVAAGTNGTYANFENTNYAELYDPVTGTFTTGATQNIPRSMPTATLLNDGRVLIVGGVTDVDDSGDYYEGAAISEIYDPVVDQFNFTGQMIELGRANHTATLLDDGKVLVVGGQNLQGAGVIQEAELYDPATGMFTVTAGAPLHARTYHSAFKLPNGKVLIVGGCDDMLAGSPVTCLLESEIYDPEQDAFFSAGDSPFASYYHAAVRLADGRVLLAGGVDTTAFHSDAYTVEMYAPDDIFSNGFD